MKKTIFYLVAAMAVLACSKTEENEVTVDSQKPVYTLYGNIAQETGTKVVIHDNKETESPHTFSHYWVAGDKISVFGDSNTPEGGYEFTVPNKEGGYDNVGEFNGVIDDKNEWGETSIYAIYPYNESNEVAVDNGPTFTVTYPAAQKLMVGSYDPASNVYVATGTGDNLTFYNTTAYLRLALYTTLESATVSKIELSTLDDTEIAGTGIVTLVPQEQPTSVGSVTVTGSNIITLTPASEISISKTSSEPTYFYVAVPAVTYDDNFAGYQVKIYSGTGAAETYQFRNFSTPLTANKVRLLPALEYNPVNSGSTATLKTGLELNKALKSLAAGSEVTDYKATDDVIQHIIIETNKNMTGYTGGTNQVAVNANPDNANEIPIIASWNADTKTIRIQTAASKIHTQQCASMFRAFTKLEDITGFENLVIGSGESSGISMGYMFMGDSKLNSLDLTGLTFEYSGAVNIMQSFDGCTSLSSFISPKSMRVGDSYYAFRNCSSLTKLDLAGFNTESDTNMLQMFYGCSSLESLDLSTFNTSNVTRMDEMFSGCSGLTSTLDLSNFNTAKVTNASKMFYGCSSLTGITFGSNSTFEACTNMSEMFRGCSGLTGPLGLSNFNTAKVTNANKMFYNCSMLTGITFGTNGTFAACTNYSSMFEGDSKIQALNIQNFKNNGDGKARNVSCMFKGCKQLADIEFTNATTNLQLAFRYVTNASEMFSGCESLETVDISTMFNTSSANVKLNFSKMCYGCTSLTSFTTRNITYDKMDDISFMFENCTALTEFTPFGNSVAFANCTNMEGVFKGCTNLTNLTLGSGFIGANGVTLTDFVPSGFTSITCSDAFRTKLVSAGILSNSN